MPSSQWNFRDWGKAVVLVAVAASCLRMGCQVERAGSSMDGARFNFQAAEWGESSRHERENIQLKATVNQLTRQAADTQEFTLIVIKALEEDNDRLRTELEQCRSGTPADGS